MGKPEVSGYVVNVPVELIDPSPFQAREFFDEAELAQLAKSINQSGVIQPLTVRSAQNGRFSLIAGERRLRAAKLAGLLQVPCIEQNVKDIEVAALGLEENLQRKDLNCFEQAKGIKELLKVWGCTQEQAAARLNMAQSTLANKLRLLSFSAAEQQYCIAKNLTERHARAALKLPLEKQRAAVLKAAAEKQLTVQATEQLIEKLLKPAKRRKKPLLKLAFRDIKIFENTINKAVSLMQAGGVSAVALRREAGGYIEYTVRIPINAAGGKSQAAQKQTGQQKTFTAGNF